MRPDREFQADFETGSEVLEGASTGRRPDAVSLDYLRAFALGPVDRQDTSEGIFDFAWYVRVDNDAGEVYIARENEAGDDWGAEQLAFSFSGDPIIEVDLAFDSNGNVVIAAERHTGSGGDPELWLEFFDSSAGSRVFTSFGAGRTPRIIHDQPSAPEFGSVVCVYVSPADDQDSLAYRQQDDRYQSETLIPVSDVENLAVEELGKNAENRLQAVYSSRDPDEGTYALEEVVSALYTFVVETEGLEAAHEPVSAAVTQVLIVFDNQPDEGLEASHEIQSASVVSIIRVVASQGQEGELSGVEVGYTEDEGLQAAHEIQSAAVAEVIILADNQPPEGLQAAHEIQSATVSAV